MFTKSTCGPPLCPCTVFTTDLQATAVKTLTAGVPEHEPFLTHMYGFISYDLNCHETASPVANQPLKVLLKYSIQIRFYLCFLFFMFSEIYFGTMFRWYFSSGYHTENTKRKEKQCDFFLCLWWLQVRVHQYGNSGPVSIFKLTIRLMTNADTLLTRE